MHQPHNSCLLPEDVLALWKNQRCTSGSVGVPFNSDGTLASGATPSGNGCANRQSLSHSSNDHEQVQTARIDYNINTNDTAWFRFQADTGVQAAYTDPINPLFNSISPQPLYSFAAGYTHVLAQNLVNYFNPAFSWYESLFAPSDFQKTLSALPIVLQGSGANARLPLSEVSTILGFREDVLLGSSSMTTSLGVEDHTRSGWEQMCESSA